MTFSTVLHPRQVDRDAGRRGREMTFEARCGCRRRTPATRCSPKTAGRSRATSRCFRVKTTASGGWFFQPGRRVTNAGGGGRRPVPNSLTRNAGREKKCARPRKKNPPPLWGTIPVSFRGSVAKVFWNLCVLPPALFADFSRAISRGVGGGGGLPRDPFMSGCLPGCH